MWINNTPNRLPNTWRGLTSLVIRDLPKAPDSFPTLRTFNRDTAARAAGRPVATEPMAGAFVETPRASQKRTRLQEVIESAVDSIKSIRRSNGPEGYERLFTSREKKRIKTLLEVAPTSTLETIAKLVKKLDDRDSSVAVGVFLRAVAVRSPIINNEQSRALETFAKRLSKLSDEKIIQYSTCLDLDSTTNSSELNPTPLSSRRGTIRTPYTHDANGDNDGLFQRFTGSCGPTALQMWLAETDPILAFALNRSEISSHSTSDRAAEFQKIVLNTYEGIALGRFESLVRARLKNGLGRLVGVRKITASQKKALLAYALEKGPKTQKVTTAIEALRGNYDGFPTDEDLSRVRADKLAPNDSGMSNEGFMYFLNHCAERMIGTRYVQTTPKWGFARGGAKRHIDKVAQALRAGYDVPFGIDEPGHYMLLTAIKGRGDNRSFLVSDPEGGRTRWVSEKRFLNGAFIKEEFELCWENQKGYVDGFFLPETVL